jgi:hypothetical protein
MDLKTLFSIADPNIVVFLLTTLVAFISWLVKGLVEKPIAESKNTFNKFLEKRIEILTEVKARLNFIAYFPDGEDSLVYKNQLQEIILKDGKTGYLSKETFNSVLKISIDPITDEQLLLDTISEINNDLYAQISKIKDEISFYKRFSNYNPLKRFIGYALLSLQYIFALTLVSSILFVVAFGLIETNYLGRILIVLTSIIGLFLIDKWMKK